MRHVVSIIRAAGGLLIRVRATAPAARASLLPLVLASAAGLLAPRDVEAQQFVTDDAAIVDFRACQLEAWHGEVASWVLPACQFVPRLELTAGIGFVAEDGSRAAEYVLQGKYLLRELTPDGWGAALVAGLGDNPLSQVGGGVAGIFAYVPLSVSLGSDRLVLHGNLGWHLEREAHAHGDHHHDEAHHALTWAARADLRLPTAGERFTLIGELFGENRTRPEYQLGVRSTLIPDRLLLDVSWGGHTAPGAPGAGWAIGLAWTPSPFF